MSHPEKCAVGGLGDFGVESHGSVIVGLIDSLIDCIWVWGLSAPMHLSLN